jgi:hypothetical protein
MMAHELDNDLREREARTRYGRSFRELSEFDQNRITYIADLKAAEAAKTAADPISEHAGIKESQLLWIVEKIAKAMAATITESVPPLVREHVQKALPDLAQPFVTGSIAKGVGDVDRFEERLRALETGGTWQSHERRLDRHGDHLAALETRLKKLERQ